MAYSLAQLELQYGDLLQVFFKQFSAVAWYRLWPDYSESYLCTVRKFPGPFSHLLVVWPGSFFDHYSSAIRMKITSNV